ncbi:MAG: DsrH/TusB family sulfur relay protein [Pseudomonadales bacterium]
MATLHIVSRAEALECCLRIAAEDDTVLLIEQGVEAARSMPSRPLLLLQEHCRSATGLDPTQTNLTTTDYDGFVDLVVTHQPVVTWR